MRVIRDSDRGRRSRLFSRQSRYLSRREEHGDYPEEDQDGAFEQQGIQPAAERSPYNAPYRSGKQVGLVHELALRVAPGGEQGGQEDDRERLDNGFRRGE